MVEKELLQDKTNILKRVSSLIAVKRNHIAKLVMEQYDAIYGYDMEWCRAKANILFKEGNVLSAKNILLNIYNKHELNLEINYNLGVYYFHLKEFVNMVIYFAKFMCFANNDSESVDRIACYILDEEVKKQLPHIETLFWDKVNVMTELYLRVFVNFPESSLTREEKEKPNDLIGKSFQVNDKYYLSGVYDGYAEDRLGYTVQEKYKDRFLYATEVIPSIVTKFYEFNCESNWIIPILAKETLQIINIQTNGKLQETQKLYKNRFYYYRFHASDKIVITSKEDFGVGQPIQLQFDNKKPKLILNLFVDGLPQAMMDECGLDFMPNTYNFFKDGTICTNAFANAEWTLASVPSIFSGTRLTTHRVFHPTHSSENLYHMPLFSEVFQQSGYTTGIISGNWRFTPIYGYVKGMDRFLYRNNAIEMSDSKIVNEIIEHLVTFQGSNEFLWSSFMDLHWVADEFELPMSCQVKMPLNMRTVEKTADKSVNKEYSLRKKERLKYAMGHLDGCLGLLYHYLEENYKGQYIVSLVSDHGQGYLIPEGKEFLSKERTNITMMFTGKGIPKGKCNELIESTDFFPTILASAGIQNFDTQEGQIPKWFGGAKERSYVITESIYPEKPYYICITDTKHQFFLHTEKNCTNDGMIDMGNYEIKLIDRPSEEEVTADYPIKVEEYVGIVIDHIKEYITAI